MNVYQKITLMECGVLKAYVNSLQQQIRDLTNVRHSLERQKVTEEAKELARDLYDELEEVKHKLEIKRQQVQGSLANG